MRPFKGNVFYREKTILRQLFFRSVGARLLDARAARSASRRKTFRFRRLAPEQFQEKCVAAFRPELRRNKDLAQFGDSEKR
ncbi:MULTISPECIES: hypothetical protein [unclassified Mesorhizobium]|uniref:hypothetical protein n=1 Tax=unclassified Mesorhizobium TaxID=325217 RepID=UPI0015E3CC52|nr:MULTISPECIES: hypothetical protein [unclassified Mesorhizobium]MBZ9885017.1 hypothetical protein [Mesorhizobium sp. CA10]